MMSYLQSKFNEISNPIDFKKLYLSDPAHSFCGLTVAPFNYKSQSFLEIATLAKLKSLHKEASFEHIRRNFYTMVLITSGSAKETIGHKSYEFTAGTLYFIPQNQLHSIHYWSSDIKGYHCIFDSDYFLLCLKDQIRLSESPFLQSGNDPFVKLSADDRKRIENVFEQLAIAKCSLKHKNDDLLLRLYLNVLFIEAEKSYFNQDKHMVILPRKQQLVSNFKKLVSLHVIEMRKVAAYAEMLHVNAHYLNDTIKAITGKTASAFIQEQLLREAKAFLIQTDETISNIAYRLNFSDQSYFCRFFKKLTKRTPFEFRSEHQHSS